MFPGRAGSGRWRLGITFDAGIKSYMDGLHLFRAPSISWFMQLPLNYVCCRKRCWPPSRPKHCQWLPPRVRRFKTSACTVRQHNTGISCPQPCRFAHDTWRRCISSCNNCASCSSRHISRGSSRSIAFVCKSFAFRCLPLHACKFPILDVTSQCPG